MLPAAAWAQQARPRLLATTILGLVALVVLAWLGGHPKVRALEERLRITELVTAGFPFVALGLVARLPQVGLLTDDLLVELSPVLRLALGWIGFLAGFRFDARLFDRLPQGTPAALAINTGIPFVLIGLVTALFFAGTGNWRDPAVLRDACILATAGAITAGTATRFLTGDPAERAGRVLRLEELAGVLGLLVIGAYFRPQDVGVTWQLPGTAWLFVTLGFGATVGGIGYAILRPSATPAESVVLLLGLISFTSGAASNLLLSPLTVSFVAGLLIANVPGGDKERIRATLERLERPIYLIFLVVVGAIWQIDEWEGWVLLLLFVPARLLGKGTAAMLGWREVLPGLADRQRVLLATPIGQLSIAIVVSAQLLFPWGNVPIQVTAVLGAAVITEITVQFLARRGERR